MGPITTPQQVSDLTALAALATAIGGSHAKTLQTIAQQAAETQALYEQTKALSDKHDAREQELQAQESKLDGIAFDLGRTRDELKIAIESARIADHDSKQRLAAIAAALDARSGALTERESDIAARSKYLNARLAEVQEEVSKITALRNQFEEKLAKIRSITE